MLPVTGVTGCTSVQSTILLYEYMDNAIIVYEVYENIAAHS